MMDLAQHGIQRFLVANVLNALQFIEVPQIQLYRLQIERVVTRNEPPSGAPAEEKRRSRRTEKTKVTEHFVVRIQGKNYGDERQIQLLFDALENQEQFREWLDPNQPITLTEIMNRQVDPSNPTLGFARFGMRSSSRKESSSMSNWPPGRAIG
jgi:hypothetical protein